jgi:signal transduction histidine kinase
VSFFRLSTFRRSILYRLVATFTLLLLLISIGGIFLIRGIVKRDLEEGTRTELVASMANLDADLGQARQEVALYAQLLASNSDERGLSRGSSPIEIALIERARSRGIDIDEVRESDPRGYGDLYRRAFAGMHTVDYVLAPGSPTRLSIVAAAPVGTAESRRVITASMSLGRQFLRQEKNSLAGDVSLYTRDEQVATSSACARCMTCIKDVLFDRANWRLIEGGKPLYFIFDCTPDSQGAVVSPVRTFDGRVVAFCFSRSRSGEALTLYHTTIGIVGGAFAFSGVMAVIFGLLTVRTIRPLKKLTRLAGEISEGRYGETIPVQTTDEVGELAGAFNRMSRSLDQAGREISEWNHTLEQRIADKTRELEKFQLGMIEVEKLAAMGQLAAGVAHELNNPLSGIMGYSELAIELFGEKSRDQIDAADIDRMITYFGHIDELSQRCRAIILDMLKFARQHDEEVSDIHLNELLQRTLVFLGKQLKQGNVEIDLALADPLPVIRGNPMQLQQVFTNLILNAAQAMPDGGRLSIRSVHEANTIIASVSDTGKGVPPELRHRIFDPFFTTKPVGEGTGLGLSVSYGIVRRHGGEIRVESEEGKGATFSVVLPVAASAVY